MILAPHKSVLGAPLKSALGGVLGCCCEPATPLTCSEQWLADCEWPMEFVETPLTVTGSGATRATTPGQWSMYVGTTGVYPHINATYFWAWYIVGGQYQCAFSRPTPKYTFVITPTKTATGVTWSLSLTIEVSIYDNPSITAQTSATYADWEATGCTTCVGHTFPGVDVYYSGQWVGRAPDVYVDSAAAGVFTPL